MSVVAANTPKLDQAEIERSKRKPIEKLDAYDYYLRGLAVVEGATKDENEDALRLYKATEIDANFATSTRDGGAVRSVRAQTR